jgi:hypothetical protein
MSNTASLQKYHLRLVPSPDDAPGPGADAASPDSSAHAGMIEQLHHSVLLLDLTAQRTRLMAMRISDRHARENLLAQIETIERLLQIGRDLLRGL